MVLLLLSYIADLIGTDDPLAHRIKIIIMSATVHDSGSICGHLLAHIQQCRLRFGQVTVPRSPEMENWQFSIYGMRYSNLTSKMSNARIRSVPPLC